MEKVAGLNFRYHFWNCEFSKTIHYGAKPASKPVNKSVYRLIG